MANKKIEDVEGIGPATGDQLRAAGIKDTDGLLAACKTAKDRKAVADASGMTEKQILKFANMVDLYRINGVGSEFAELLEAAGVDTVPELATRNAANLTKAMADVNASKALTRRVPTEAEVTKWVAEAKTLPRVIEY
jgi:predicted flap endonuclease-1-like 5' DNA nuclease